MNVIEGARMPSSAGFLLSEREHADEGIRAPFQLRLQASALLVSLGLLLMGLLSNGCVSRPAIQQQTFAFSSPAPATKTTPGHVVALRSVVVSPLFSDQQFVYRIGPQAYEKDPYAAFLVPPSQAFALAISASLRSSGKFEDVVAYDGRSKADKVIEIQVFDLYGDFRETGPGVAVLSIRICLFDAEQARTRQPALKRDFSRRISLRERTASAVMEGWDTALGEIMAEFASELSSHSPQSHREHREGDVLGHL